MRTRSPGRDRAAGPVRRPLRTQGQSSYQAEQDRVAPANLERGGRGCGAGSDWPGRRVSDGLPRRNRTIRVDLCFMVNIHGGSEWKCCSLVRRRNLPIVICTAHRMRWHSPAPVIGRSYCPRPVWRRPYPQSSSSRQSHQIRLRPQVQISLFIVALCSDVSRRSVLRLGSPAAVEAPARIPGPQASQAEPRAASAPAITHVACPGDDQVKIIGAAVSRSAAAHPTVLSPRVHQLEHRRPRLRPGRIRR